MQDKLLISGKRLLLGLDWNDYLGQFVPIDEWNPPDGDVPPEENPHGFTTDEVRLRGIVDACLDPDGDGDEPGCESFSYSHDSSFRLVLLRRLLEANPALQDMTLDIGPYLEASSEDPLSDSDLPSEGSVRLLEKLASGAITETDLKDQAAT